MGGDVAAVRLRIPGVAVPRGRHVLACLGSGSPFGLGFGLGFGFGFGLGLGFGFGFGLGLAECLLVCATPTPSVCGHALSSEPSASARGAEPKEPKGASHAGASAAARHSTPQPRR